MDPTSGYQVEEVRAHFPSLRGGTAYFDGPGGSQTPDVVAEAIAASLASPLSNHGTVTRSERNAEGTVFAARAAMADLLNTDPRGIVFGRSMTALTFELARTMAASWSGSDEVVLTRLDHDANIRPWIIAAQRAGASVRWADFDPDTGELDTAELVRSISVRTKVVALTGASNLIGTRPDVRAVADAAHDVGAWVYVDGVHLSAHAPVDMAVLGADFYACSPYKFFGPHLGVLAGRVQLLEQLRPDKLLPSANTVPERFELGTLPYELLAGTAAAVDFIAGLAPGGGTRRQRIVRSMSAVEEHEDAIRRRIEEALPQLPFRGVRLHSRAARRTPTLLLTFEEYAAAQIYRWLAEADVNAPAGSFYALEASRRLGLGEAGGLRIGIAPYTDDTDVDRLLSALGAIPRDHPNLGGHCGFAGPAGSEPSGTEELMPADPHDQHCATCGSATVAWRHPLRTADATFTVGYREHTLPGCWYLCQMCEDLYQCGDTATLLGRMAQRGSESCWASDAGGPGGDGSREALGALLRADLGAQPLPG